MNADQMDNVVRKMLERLDCEVGQMLGELDEKTLNELKANPPMWVNLMNIDLDFYS